MPKMPCSISDGPQTPEDADELWNRPEQDPDEAHDRRRQEEIDDAAGLRRSNERVEEAYNAPAEPTLHTKVGSYTGQVLYSYDQAYWWSTEETALRMFNKLQGTNDNE